MKQIKRLFNGSIAHNAFWLIAARIYQMAVNLLVSMLTARWLGPSNYGLINYAASMTAMFTSLCTLGINSILVNELLKDETKQGEILGSAIGLRLLSSLLSVITIVALTAALNPREQTTILVVLVYSLSLTFQTVDSLNYWYQAKLRSKTTAIISAVGYTVTSVYRILLLVSRRSVIWFAASHLVEYGLVAVLLLSAYRADSEKTQKLRFSLRTGSSLLRKSYHFILSGVMVAVYGQMDRIMLKSMLDEAAVGYYSAALSVTNMWPFVLAAIIDSVKPSVLKQYHVNTEAFERQLAQLYGIILYISFAAGAAITLLSKPIILILFGKSYLPARSVLCILCWDTAFAYLGVARSIWLVPQGKQKYEKYIAASGAVCNLALNGILIPVWGIGGAALATLLTQIITNFVVGFFFPEIRRNNFLILRGFCFWREKTGG